jgi:hypothetical protein
MQAARIRLPDGRISWTVLDAEHETVESVRAWLLHLENIHMAPNTAPLHGDYPCDSVSNFSRRRIAFAKRH